MDDETTEAIKHLSDRVTDLEREVALMKKKSLTPDEARESLGLPSGEGEPPP